MVPAHQPLSHELIWTAAGPAKMHHTYWCAVTTVQCPLGCWGDEIKKWIIDPDYIYINGQRSHWARWKIRCPGTPRYLSIYLSIYLPIYLQLNFQNMLSPFSSVCFAVFRTSTNLNNPLFWFHLGLIHGHWNCSFCGHTTRSTVVRTECQNGLKQSGGISMGRLDVTCLPMFSSSLVRIGCMRIGKFLFPVPSGLLPQW